MTSKIISTLKTKVVTREEVRVALFILMVAMFLLGAGAPSDGGGLGGL